MSASKKQSSAPKNAKQKPTILSAIFLILIIIIWVPHTLPLIKNGAGIQMLYAIILAPLAIIGLYLAFSSGLLLVKSNYNHIKKDKLLLPYIKLIAIHLGCVGGCLFHEYILFGYPFRICVNTCQLVYLHEAAAFYLVVSAILLLPAYIAIFLYRK